MNMKICDYNFDEFLNIVKAFHGSPAPGVILGGIMVDLALKELPRGLLYDAISETGKCLPDAIQLLTPCTVGNGWLKIIETGRFAMSLYDKLTGEGIRVSVDIDSLSKYPMIWRWFFKMKDDSNLVSILDEIKRAGNLIFVSRKVRLYSNIMAKKKQKKISICPLCGESFPNSGQRLCLHCSGKVVIYEIVDDKEERIGNEYFPNFTYINK